MGVDAIDKKEQLHIQLLMLVKKNMLMMPWMCMPLCEEGCGVGIDVYATGVLELQACSSSSKSLFIQGDSLQ